MFGAHLNGIAGFGGGDRGCDRLKRGSTLIDNQHFAASLEEAAGKSQNAQTCF